LAAARSGGRGYFQPDETRTHDADPSSVGQRGAKCEAVVDRAQDVRVLERLPAEVAWGRAGRDDEGVVVNGRAVVEQHTSTGNVDLACAPAETQVQLQRVQLVRSAQCCGRWFGVAAKNFLRQRRSRIGRVLLVADQDDRVGVALPSQGLARAQARKPSSDDGNSQGFTRSGRCASIMRRKPSRHFTVVWPMSSCIFVRSRTTLASEFSLATHLSSTPVSSLR